MTGLLHNISSISSESFIHQHTLPRNSTILAGTMFILRFIQCVSFFIAQVTNSILIYLIFRSTGRIFGRFRYLMGTFAIYSLIYSWVEFLTMPIMHIKGPSMIVYMDSFLKYDKWIAQPLVQLYCGSFAFCISLLVIQFIYRYVAVVHPDKVNVFEGINMLVFFTVPLFYFAIWLFDAVFIMTNTQEKRDLYRDEIKGIYGEDIDRLSFISFLYKSTHPEKTGQVWYPWELAGLFSMLFVLISCFTTILTCAKCTYDKMRENKEKFSSRTMELNRQLFLTLSFQTILPLVLMYIPVGLFIVFPALEIGIGSLSNLTAAALAVYPALEPLIAMFLITDFRNFVLRRNHTRVTSTFATNGTTTKASTMKSAGLAVLF